MEPSISTQLNSVRFCDLVLPIPFPRFYPDSHLPVLSSIQPSNFRSSFERQTRQRLVNTMVLVHPPRGLLYGPQCSSSTLSKPWRLPSFFNACSISFPFAKPPHQVGFRFFCARHHRSFPCIASLEVSSLLSSARVDQNSRSFLQ